MYRVWSDDDRQYGLCNVVADVTLHLFSNNSCEGKYGHEIMRKTNKIKVIFELWNIMT